METLTNTLWDVIISGTNLKNSLLALALSRSNKKILHIDHNKYYGGVDASLCFHEVKGWIDVYKENDSSPFRNAILWKSDNANDQANLSSSRSYTFALSPTIIYSKSRFLSLLISSKVYRHLEFQAVGNWWLFDVVDSFPVMRRIPNGREDIFHDKKIDNRSKRSLMKFLRFVVDFENQTDIWTKHTDNNLEEFLSSEFQLPINLHKLIAALTLTFYAPNKTTVGWALPRISRHLKSLGVHGPGFGSVVVKWGCSAEILQAACRACAVGGGVYMLGTSTEKICHFEEPEDLFEVQLSSGLLVKTKHFISNPKEEPKSGFISVSRIIAITTSSLEHLFQNNIEGAPLSAVSIIVFPPGTLTDDDQSQPQPVYIMVHSSETGECPNGQYVLYASTLSLPTSKTTLEKSISKLMCNTDRSDTKILFSLYCEYIPKGTNTNDNDGSLFQPTDLVSDDRMFDDIQAQWQKITASDDSPGEFMNFEERTNEILDEFETSDY